MVRCYEHSHLLKKKVTVARLIGLP
jgi:hypothetical protein